MTNDVKQSWESFGRGTVKLVLAVVLMGMGAIVMAIATVACMRIPGDPIVQVGVGQVLGGLFPLLGVLLLGGRRWLSPNSKAITYTFRIAWVLLIVGAIAIGVSVYEVLTSGQSMPAEVLPRFAGAALLCLGIGISEEFIHRGLVLGGLLAVIGRSRVGVMAAVLISSVFFGFAHVTPDDFATTATAIQAVLKIVQTGMFGIVMCAAVMHTRNLWGAVVFHAINDFLYLGVPSMLSGMSSTGNYTAGGDAAVAGIGVYVFMIAVFLYPTVRALKAIWNEQDRCLGPFMEPRKRKGEMLPVSEGMLAEAA